MPMKKPLDELKLTGNLPTPAGVGMKILALTQREDFKAEDIARTIQTDPALTGRIIKMANSAGTSGVKAITSVNEAVVRLGARTVRNVALGFSLISAYRQGACRAFDYRRYWSDSLARAVAAQALCARLRLGASSEAYICGLLSGIGRLALACIHPQSYADVLRRVADGSEAELAAAEQAAFEMDHRELGAAMLDDWLLPKAYGIAVGSYSCPPEEDEAGDAAVTRLRLLLRVAQRVARVLASSELERPRAMLDLLEARKLTPLAEPELFSLCDQVAAEWCSWGKALDIETAGTPPFAELAFEAREAQAQRERREAEQAGGQSPAGTTSAAATAAAELIAAADEATSCGAMPDGCALTVLVIEDDPVALKLLDTHLRRAGYVVHTATDGVEGLRLALEVNPHIVLSDWMMPGMDGLEVTRALRRVELGREMYVLLLTGREEEARVVEAFEAGVDDYVSKPFNARILISRVNAGARLVRLQDQVARDKKRMEVQVAELAIMRRRLENTSITDPLTQLFNRRAAAASLEDAWQKRGAALSVIALDLDHFKTVNDEFGHEAGDTVLKEAANVLRSQIRRGDIVCRIGGEEFLVICPGSAADQASLIAERLRVALEAHGIPLKGGMRGITASLGVAERDEGMAHPDDLLRAADAALYRAKSEGRNRVSLYRAA